MTALALAPEATYVEPIVGWRIWRILPFETLQGEESYRLCAAGRGGIPKVWEPRAATCAVCSQFGSTHEAPWPDCDCGIYAFCKKAGAADLLEHYVDTPNAKGVAGWAVGRVSLWGRVVECEKGWRGQFAYPYALTVHAPAEIAEAVRGVYAVDVEAKPDLEPTPVEEVEESEVDQLEGELNVLIARMHGLQARVRATRPPIPPPVTVKPDDLKGPFGIAPEQVTTELVVFGIFLANHIASSTTTVGLHAEPRFFSYAQAVYRDSIQKAAAFVLGDADGHEWRNGAWRPREGWPRFQQAVNKALVVAEADGLVEKGRFGSRGSLYWRLSQTGIAAVRAYGRRTLPAQPIVVPLIKFEWQEGRSSRVAAGELRVDVRVVGKRDLMRGRAELFAPEVEALRPVWRQQRRDAQAAGRAHYRAWLRDWLESGERTELLFTDDEVLSAVTYATRRGPVLASRIMERLAPGLGTQSASATAKLSQALVRLAERGLVARAGREAGREAGRWLWQVA